MWTTGQTVLDRYTLRELLAEGGGGETWSAEGPAGAVAIKRIQSQDRRRFRDLMREASLLREMRHPHIVSYREFSDRPDDDCAILVTDLVEGGDLEGWLLLAGPRPVPEVASLGLQIVDALEVLAEAEVLHRDLKPTNILVASDDGAPTLRVTDFGISRSLEDGVARTQDRSLTPLYAAPEQHTGGPLTPAADVYALGGVLGFLATGQHPTQGGVPTGEPVLDPLIGRLRALEPTERPSLEQTRRALEAIRDGDSPDLSGPPVAPLDHPARARGSTSSPAPSPTAVPHDLGARPGRRQLTAGLLGGAGLLLATAGAAVLLRAAAPPMPDATVAVEPTARSADPIPAPPPEPARATPQPAPSEPLPAPPAVGRPSTAATAVLFVNSKPFSTIVVDGTERGDTGNFGARIELSAGVHEVRLVGEGGLQWTGRVELPAEARLCVNLRYGTRYGC